MKSQNDLHRMIQFEAQQEIREQKTVEARLRKQLEKNISDYRESVNRLATLESVRDTMTLMQEDPFEAQEYAFRRSAMPRGAKTLKVLKIASVLRRPFTRKDITYACPDIKAVSPILTKLCKHGYLRVVERRGGRAGNVYMMVKS